MNPQTIAAVRIVIMLVGGFAVGHGWVSQDSLDSLTEPTTFATLIGGIAAIVAAGYAIYSKRKQGILKDASKVLGNEGVIVAPADIANRLPKNVVPTVEEAEKVAPVRLRRSHAAPKPTN